MAAGETVMQTTVRTAEAVSVTLSYEDIEITVRAPAGPDKVFDVIGDNFVERGQVTIDRAQLRYLLVELAKHEADLRRRVEPSGQPFTFLGRRVDVDDARAIKHLGAQLGRALRKLDKAGLSRSARIAVEGEVFGLRMALRRLGVPEGEIPRAPARPRGP